MFKNLLSFWKGKDFLVQVLEDFKCMLDDSETMFEAVCAQLLVGKEEGSLKDKIYEIDKQVNNLQKEIRRRIVEHLSLQPSVDVNACLILMSVVKDAERLGDYSKNLYEVTQLLAEPIDCALFSEYFDEMDKKILALFQQTKKAFIEADEEQARSAWQYEKKIAKGCDKIVERLAKSNLTVNQAVCFALVARHFKRIVAHLVNIATSVVLPLSDLDYFDEKRYENYLGD
jgi:phosphate transport system protein